jgi:hypothetical protein
MILHTKVTHRYKIRVKIARKTKFFILVYPESRDVPLLTTIYSSSVTLSRAEPLVQV